MTGLLETWPDFTAGTPGRHLATENVLGPMTAIANETYAATITPDVSTAWHSVITVTDNVDFTIANPTGASSSGGEQLTVHILNSSGGAMGTITWGTKFNLAGAFTNPASTKTRTISFYNDGSRWFELGRAANDI